MRRRTTVAMMMFVPCLVAASTPPQPTGLYGRWGAFRASDPTHCYAITQPERAKRRDTAYLTVSTWPARRLFRQVHVRFRGVADEGATLSIGDHRFALRSQGADGWPRSQGEGRQIARLLREGGMLRVRARIGRRRITDSYALAGAASAIDAADLACLRER